MAFAGAVGILLSIASANAISTYSIRGTVTNRLGAPIEGATVSDGNGGFDRTDAKGRYDLQMLVPQTYILHVSMSGFVSQLRPVSPVEALEAADFTLSHTLSSAITTPRAFPGTTEQMQLEVESGVPEGSCLEWTDSATGQTLALSPASPAPYGGRYWRGTAQVSGHPDGSFEHTVRAFDCRSRVEIANAGTDRYIIDSVPPSMMNVRPADGSIVAAGSMSLWATVSDDGSGIVPSGFSFQIEPIGGPTTSLAGTWDYLSGTLRSSSFTAVEGTAYRATIAVVDYAGNVTTSVATFTTGPPRPPETVRSVAPYDYGFRCAAAGGVMIVVTVCPRDWVAESTGEITLLGGITWSGVGVDVAPPWPGTITATVEGFVSGSGVLCVAIVEQDHLRPLAKECSADGAPTVRLELRSTRTVQIRAWLESARVSTPPPADDYWLGLAKAEVTSISYTLSS